MLPFFLNFKPVDELIRYLSGFVSPGRLARFSEVLASRTRYLTVVLEDIYQSQNASAVVRTCDCFGIQDIHIIENKNSFTMDGQVALGAEKWLTIYRHSDTEDNSLSTIRELRSKGYRIVATSPDPEGVGLADFNPLAGKSAVFFGTELTGLSASVLNNADEFLTIPMYGFTRSYNLSVSVALVLQNLVCRIQASDMPWQLSYTEQQVLRLEWLRKTIRDVRSIERQFLENKN